MKYIYLLIFLISLCFAPAVEAQTAGFWIGSWKVDKEATIEALPEDISGLESQLVGMLIDQMATRNFEYIFTNNTIYLITDGGVGKHFPYKTVELGGEYWLQTEDEVFCPKKTAKGIRYPIETDSGGILWLILVPKK